MTMPDGGDLLTTGEVAVVLGVSRQHVVNLCSRGLLPFVVVGTHRRVRHRDVDEFLGGRLTREAERSLWLHLAVAGRLVLDPESGMPRALSNVERMLAAHPTGMGVVWLSRWRDLLHGGIDGVLDVLVSRAATAVELRQNSPFAGVLTNDDRARVLAAFRDHWRRDHAA